MTDQTLEQLERECREKVQGWKAEAYLPDYEHPMRGYFHLFDGMGILRSQPKKTALEALEKIPPLTDTEYFGPGGLLDIAIQKYDFGLNIMDIGVLCLKFISPTQSRPMFEVDKPEDGPPSTWLKKAILIAHLKGSK